MRFNKQSGQALIGTAVAMVVLCGFAGLAIDMGTLRYQKRLQQTAADAAAIAGAQDLEFGSGWVAGGQNASALNGFTDNNGGAGCVGGSIGCISVAINKPPSTGPHSSDSKYVEAIVTEIQPTYFMQIFGVSSEPVTARAVATNVSGGTSLDCLYTLGPPTSAIVGLDATGHAIINAPACGIGDNGNLDTTGNAYTIKANSISVNGTCIGSACGSPKDMTCYAYANNVCPSSQLNNAGGTSDPFTGMVPPSQPAASPSCPNPACNWSSPDYPPNSSVPPVTIQPGTYSSISIGKNSVVIMAPGIYYINGATAPNAGLNFNGGGTLTSSGCPPTSSTAPNGVMIYFTNGSSINKAVGGGSNADLTLCPLNATQSSTYAGFVFYQDPADTTTAYFGGDNNNTYYGTIYMPTATITLYGNSTQTFNGDVVSYAFATTGSPIANFDVSTPGVPIPAKLTQPVLVE